MEFGDWLRSRRQYRKLDIRALAEISHVDPSTISRIENLHTQSTLYTAYRLCKGLQVSSSDLYYGLNGTEMAVRASISEDKGLTLGVADIKVLFDDLMLNKTDTYHYFAYVLNKISVMSQTTKKQAPAAQFTYETIEAFLSGAYRSVFRFELNYPRDIHSNVVLYNYERGGVLVLEDIGAYARDLRRSRQATLKDLEGKTTMSISVLSRLEDGALERIKLADILGLDAALEQSGRLLDMCWDVCSFDEWMESEFNSGPGAAIPSTRRQAPRIQAIILLYIRACRWFQHVQGPDSEWPKYRVASNEKHLFDDPIS